MLNISNKNIKPNRRIAEKRLAKMGKRGKNRQKKASLIAESAKMSLKYIFKLCDSEVIEIQNNLKKNHKNGFNHSNYSRIFAE